MVQQLIFFFVFLHGICPRKISTSSCTKRYVQIVESLDGKFCPRCVVIDCGTVLLLYLFGPRACWLLDFWTSAPLDNDIALVFYVEPLWLQVICVYVKLWLRYQDLWTPSRRLTRIIYSVMIKTHSLVVREDDPKRFKTTALHGEKDDVYFIWSSCMKIVIQQENMYTENAFYSSHKNSQIQRYPYSLLGPSAIL